MKIITLFLFLTSILLAQENIDFSTETLDNETITLSESIGNGPTLVTFWALWCKPCRAELKHLQKIYEEYENQGFTIIGVNQDSPRSIAKVKSFVKTHGLSFPIVTDPNQEIFQEFNGQSIPLLFLYKKNGDLAYSHVGYLPGDEIELEQKVKELLEK